MRSLSVQNPAKSAARLLDEIRRSEESRYDHRIHGVLLVARGMSCPEVAALLGDAPRTVEYWVRRFNEKGLNGLRECARAGRPRHLEDWQLSAIHATIHGMPGLVTPGGVPWSGRTLSTWISELYGIHLSVRHCQRLLKKWGIASGLTPSPELPSVPGLDGPPNARPGARRPRRRE